MPKKVLIIDDEPEIAKMVADFLLSSGYAAYQALNGPAGLELIEKENPDLVLLDIGMPGMNGLDVLQAIRKKHPALAVVILSAHTEVETMKKALRAGILEYIAKPINLETLLNQFVKELIGPPV